MSLPFEFKTTTIELASLKAHLWYLNIRHCHCGQLQPSFFGIQKSLQWPIVLQSAIVIVTWKPYISKAPPIVYLHKTINCRYQHTSGTWTTVVRTWLTVSVTTHIKLLCKQLGLALVIVTVSCISGKPLLPTCMLYYIPRISLCAHVYKTQAKRS